MSRMWTGDGKFDVFGVLTLCPMFLLSAGLGIVCIGLFFRNVHATHEFMLQGFLFEFKFERVGWSWYSCTVL